MSFLFAQTDEFVGEWLSLVEHLVRDQGVGGSNPLSPTNLFQELTTILGFAERQRVYNKVSRLPDGSRVAAVLPPCSIDGITLTIRKFNTRHFTMADLIEKGTLSAKTAELLGEMVTNRQNILISGGTGSGKTTLLNILADSIPDDERILLIEDTSELNIRKSNLVRFETRREQTGLPAVTVRDLLKAALRHRPDRIIVGEVRGGEAFDLLQALNTGHAGSFCTLHANSAGQAVTRFADCVLQSGIELPHRAIMANIGSAVDLLVHIGRTKGQRRVSEIAAMRGFDNERNECRLDALTP